ncbi:MAG: carboxylase, partial [Candidatus Delongbacteria bacterium]|nr:carboxylase [Candidatus Delongbacteria bacterium]
MKKLKIRDLTLRDGQQSQFATRMKQEQVDRVLPYYSKAGFYACEVWGGAVPDSVMRYLNENPWDRLEKIKAAIGESSKLTSLSRGRNLFGYAPYPDEVIEGFTKLTLESGLDIVRIFDALNDVNNMKSTIKFVKKYGGIPDCAVCFTIDPKFTFTEKIKAFLNRKKLPKDIFNVEYFVRKAEELEKEGAGIITIKDMAGLIHPKMAGDLIRALKRSVKTPVNLHTHDTPGYGLASILMAIINGADIVDTVLYPFAGGPAAPSFELVQIFCDKLGIETGVDLKQVSAIDKELFEIRNELSEYDTTKLIPIPFDISDYKLDPEIDSLF